MDHIRGDDGPGVLRRKPQIKYSVLKKSIQKEGGLLQRATPGISEAFHPVEDSLQHYFLSDLFRGATASIL